MFEKSKKPEQWETEELPDIELDCDDLEQVSGGFSETSSLRSSNKNEKNGKEEIQLPVIKMK